MGCHWTSIRMTKMKNSYNAKCWQQREIGSFVSNETKHTFPIMIQQLHSWAFIPEKWKLLVTQKPNCWAFIPEKWKLNRHTKTSAWQFHFSLIHNTLKLETIQMSFNEWVVKETMVHPFHIILFRRKRKGLLILSLT